MHSTMAMTHAGDICKVCPRKTTCSIACLKILSKRVTDSGSNVTEKSPRPFDLLAHAAPVAQEKIEARKMDVNGGSVYSETPAEKS